MSLGKYIHKNENAEPLDPSQYKLEDYESETQEQAENGLDEDSLEMKIPFSFLFRPAVLAIVILIVCVLAFFMAGQAVRLLGVVSALPAPLRWTGWIGIWVLVLLSTGSLCYLLFTLLRLKTSPSLELPGSKFISMSHTRRTLRQSRKIKSEMEQYLHEYPIEKEHKRKYFRKLGLDKDDIERIIKLKTDMLQQTRCSEYDWLKRFDSGFLSQLDAVALRRIKRYSLATGVTTAAFPVSFISASVVLINSYMMIGDLCRLYRLRARVGFTLAIFAWSFVHTLAASRLGEFTEEGAESLMGSIEAEVESGTVNFLGKRIAPKLTEGAINALIIRILGKQAMKRLKPMNVVDK